MDIGAGTGVGLERKLDRLDLGLSDRAGGDGFEGAQELALKALNAISSNLRAGGDQATHYQLLTASIAGLVGARRVLFWQLNPDRTLTAIAGAYGIGDDFIARLYPAPCDPEGTDLTSRVVYGDHIFRSALNDQGQSESDRRVLEVLQVKDAISAPWRAGDERLGVIAAYDSNRPDGFTRADAAALQVSGLAAGLVWQLKQAEAQLEETVARLQKIDAARALLLKNLSTAVDRATKTFATDLHDGALQKLTAAELELARASAQDKGGPASGSLEHVRTLLGEVEDALRHMLLNIRPPSLEAAAGLQQAVQERIERMRLAVDYEVDAELAIPVEPPYEIKALLYRQVNEALTNVEKHAAPARVRVTLKAENAGIYGSVIDDGRGFVVAERSRLPGHLGLLALNERAHLAGGWCKVTSEPGAGTIVEFWVPVP